MMTAISLVSRIINIHCVSKNIPDIFECNLKTNYPILIIFGTDISDTTCRQMTDQVVVNFVPKFVAMATAVARREI